MMQEERIQIISDYLKERNAATVPVLASMLHVSMDTIRRDLRILEKRGIVNRVHGGAVLSTAHGADNLYPIRNTTNTREKAEIAEKAAAMVQEGQFIAINAGTTGNQLARRLVTTHRILSILTNSLTVASLLSANPGFSIILSGGDLNDRESSLGGRLAEYTLSQYFTDAAFLSINAVSIAGGLTDFREEEVGVINTILPRSRNRIVIASSDKLERRSNIFVAPLSDIDTLVTDNKINPEYIARYRNTGVELLF